MLYIRSPLQNKSYQQTLQGWVGFMGNSLVQGFLSYPGTRVHKNLTIDKI